MHLEPIVLIHVTSFILVPRFYPEVM